MLLSCDAAALAVKEGDVIAYPTEAIYGLGCDPLNQSAIEKILQLKSRASNKGLILIASQWQQLEAFVELSDPNMLERVRSSWPGPVTWIMPASSLCTELLTGNRPTIAVRVSSHPVVQKLCNACGCALVSTSANISGEAPLPTAEEIARVFASNIAGVVAGELGGLKNATSIFDASSGVQLR